MTYWALAEMVRSRCRIAEDEEPSAALAKLRAMLAEHLLDEDERRFVEPRLARLLAVGESESVDRQELFAAWRLFFERLADSHPVLFVFEDLQWADTSLLDFVEYLLEWSRNHPIFVVTLARPELLDRRPTWGAGQRNFRSLYLEPLSEQAMRELLVGLVPGLPDELTAQILSRAEGVPLYAVETVRMLLDRGLLVEDGPAYRLVGEVGPLDVPETLHALIAARLDGLSEEERLLLQDGAVLGKTFTRQAIAALAALEDADLESLLTSLVRKEVLGLQTDPRSPALGQYGFLQDLVRSVAYETLSKRERKVRHLAAAEQLGAALGEEEAAEIVASHLLEAYRAAPEASDAAELKARAGDALVRAGERAGSLGAASEAQRYFEQAAELDDDPFAKAELTGRAGEMAHRANRPIEARALLERAHAAFAERGDTRVAARFAVILAEVDFNEGHPQQAVARLGPAVEALEAGEPDAALAEATGQLGRFLVLSGEYEQAAPHIERALALAEELELPETLAQALNTKSVSLLRRHRRHEARLLLEGALELALAHDLHAAALRAYNNLVVLLEESGRTRDTLPLLERALELARRAGGRGSEAQFLGASIGTLRELGRWDEALARTAEAEELATTAFAQGFMLAAVAIHCERGLPEEARRLFEGLEVVGRSTNPDHVGWWAVTQARLLRAEGRPQDALAAARRALDVYAETGAGPRIEALVEALEAAAAVDDAELRVQLAAVDSLPPGDLMPLLKAQQARFRARLEPDDADTLYNDAEQLLRELGVPFHLAVVRLEHAQRLAAEGQAEPAEPLLADAREIFDRLRAKPWLDRVAAASASFVTVA